MSFNGSGLFQINSSGQPVVANTLIAAAVFNAFTADIATGLSNCITKDGQTTVTGNIPFGGFKLTGVGAATALTDAPTAAQVQNSAFHHLTSPAGTNTITATATPTPSAYAVGQQFEFVPAATNTGATTLNVSSLGAKNVFINGGACVGGEIKLAVPALVVYDGTQFNLVAPGSPAVLGANTFTGAQNHSTAASQNLSRVTVASHATTANIWAAGHQIDWTGTATTTIFPNAPQAGAERVLICAGACSFTAGANMLIDGVASAATVTCAANDQVIVRAVSTTQFKLSRVKYDGTAQVVAAAANGLVWLSTVTASNSATVDVETTFNSTYDSYLLVCSGVTVGTDAVFLYLRMKLGGTYLTTGTYGFSRSIITTDGAATTVAVSGAGETSTEIILADATVTNAGLASANLDINIHNPASTAFVKKIRWRGDWVSALSSAQTTRHAIGVGLNQSTAALTGIRIYASAGNILAGKFRLYGIANS